MDIAVLFGTFIVLVMLTVPIGYAIGMATLVTLVFFSNMPVALITQNAITGVDSFPLMAIPFFMLAGNLMSSGGVAKRIVNFCDTLLGWITGGLGIVTTLACMFFAAISGSAMATTSAIGGFMIPEMEERGYDRAFSAALAGAAGTIGVIIPPSIPFVIYAVVVNTSISDLFIAGLLPGILMGVALMVVCVFVSKKEGYQVGGKRPSLRQVWISFKDAFWALLTPVIILGGIYSGMFTPTESAVVAVIYCVIVSVFVYREFKLKDVYKALYVSINVNGMTTFMVGFSMAFAAYLTMEKIPQRIASALLSVTSQKVLLLLLINLLLLVVGCLIDNIPATIILSPILLPIVEKLGMSPVTFGVMLTMNLAIGFITPPYGINLFVAAAISKEPMSRMIKPMLRFILALLVVLMLVTFCEPVTIGMLNLIKG
ncbi:MAG: TRAP transporter large permease [Lawsonibacter sp.]